MPKFISNLSLKWKLLLVALLPAVISLLFAGLLLITLEIKELQKNIRENLITLAAVIAQSNSSALLLEDKNIAIRNLTALNTRADISGVCIYNSTGTVFVQFINNHHQTWACPQVIKDMATHFEQLDLHIVQAVTEEKSRLGTVYIHVNYSQALWQKIKLVGLIFAVLLGMMLLALLLLIPLLKNLFSSIDKLTNTINTINKIQDYSLQASKNSNDEIGVLVDAFNEFMQGVNINSQILVRARDHYRMLYDDNPTMVFNLTETGRILSINRTGAKQLGLNAEELQENYIFDFIHPSDLPIIYTLIEYCLLSPLLVHKREFRQICCNGRIVWVKATIGLVENEHQQVSLLLVCEDITEARNLSEKIAYQSRHDALTGFANRNEFDRYIKQALILAHSSNTEHALCYLDLDQFKVVNDNHGHIAGDEFIRQLGDLLRKNIRQHDFVARLGGDEFGILMYNCTLIEAFKACEKLRDLIRAFRFVWEDKSFSVSVSIGISAINNLSSNSVDLLNEADAACCASKEKGRNRVHLFRPDDEELATRRGQMQWVGKIRTGLDENRFCLYGQPIVSLSGKTEGLHFETLIRYRDDRGHIVPPSAYLPAAERYNLATEIDRWVISTMFEWMANKPDFVKQLSLCSINMSGLSLSDETMLDFIAQQFAHWKIPTHKICFEITETAAIANLSYATRFIQQLRDNGCSFSLDDFGSGLSSFAYLKNLPVDYLKIDGLFVKNILADKVDLAMVKSINEVGHVMNKKTIAEFVENEEIFNLLRQLGVDYGQGYGIGKPVPLDELTANKIINSD